MPNFMFLGPTVWAVRCQISQSVLNFIYIDLWRALPYTLYKNLVPIFQFAYKQSGFLFTVFSPQVVHHHAEGRQGAVWASV